MIFGSLLNLALVALLVPVFAKYWKEEEIGEYFYYIGIGGIFFLLANSFELGVWESIPKAVKIGKGYSQLSVGSI